jgi:hypothetical protein
MRSVVLAAGLLSWQPGPLEHPVELHIFSRERYEAHRLFSGLPPGTRAFALLEPDGRCVIYLTPESLRLIWHELRHCQEGQWHQ